jgi:hypothetical protein
VVRHSEGVWGLRRVEYRGGTRLLISHRAVNRGVLNDCRTHDFVRNRPRVGKCYANRDGRLGCRDAPQRRDWTLRPRARRAPAFNRIRRAHTHHGPEMPDRRRICGGGSRGRALLVSGIYFVGERDLYVLSRYRASLRHHDIWTTTCRRLISFCRRQHPEITLDDARWQVTAIRGRVVQPARPPGGRSK